jgi:phosphoribosylformylglycinamidine synthase
MTSPALPAAGLALVLVGEEGRGWLGRSLFRAVVHGREDGAPPPVDLAAERRGGEFVLDQIRSGAVGACHDLSDGGLAVAVAEMCLAGGIGATLDGPVGTDRLFGEDQGRYLVAVEPGRVGTLVTAAAVAGVPAREVGRTGGDALHIPGEAPISLPELGHRREAWLPAYMAAAAAGGVG